MIQKKTYLERYAFMWNKNIIIYQYYEKFLPPKTTSPFHTTPWYLDKRITAEKGWDYNAAFHFGWYTMYDNSILFRDTVFIFSLVSWNTVFGIEKELSVTFFTSLNQKLVWRYIFLAGNSSCIFFHYLSLKTYFFQWVTIFCRP